MAYVWFMSDSLPYAMAQTNLQKVHLMRNPKKKFQILNGVSGVLKPVRPSCLFLLVSGTMRCLCTTTSHKCTIGLPFLRMSA